MMPIGIDDMLVAQGTYTHTKPLHAPVNVGNLTRLWWGGTMTVSGYAWRHPANYQEAKARLVGRQKLNAERKRFAGLLRDEQIAPLLWRYGFFSWGTVTRIAKELGLHKSCVSRHRAIILRSLVGQ